MGYWEQRQAEIQDRLTRKKVKDVEKQLTKYYGAAAKQVIEDFENTYNKLLATIEDGREPTPADLYKLDKYWQSQSQLRKILTDLGEKQISLLTKEFELHFFEVYYSFALPSAEAFSTIDAEGARRMINSIWLADGKHFSQRVWGNTEKLLETLNDQLVHTVVAGKKTTELKHMVMERFNVSYSRADTLVRTELAHVQTVAAKQRYQDYGIQKYRILGNDDDSCGNHGVDCHQMDGKEFYFAEMVEGKNAPPFHPNCRCSIIPVVE